MTPERGTHGGESGLNQGADQSPPPAPSAARRRSYLPEGSALAIVATLVLGSLLAAPNRTPGDEAAAGPAAPPATDAIDAPAAIATASTATPSSGESAAIETPASPGGAATAPAPAAPPASSGGLVGVAAAEDQRGFGASPPPMTTAEIAVKFRDEQRLKPIADLFWRDAEGARSRFRAFCAERPEFRGLVLDRVTYSNEFVLVYEPGTNPPARQARELAARLSALPDVSYAEPSLVAHPGDR